MDWTSCCSGGWAKSISPDAALISDLKLSARNKERTAVQIQLDDISASSVVSLLYDSARELLEALAIQRGFKLYNHECYSAFLAEVMHDAHSAKSFDRLRKIRNNANYNGRNLSAAESRPIIKELKQIIVTARAQL